MKGNGRRDHILVIVTLCVNKPSVKGETGTMEGLEGGVRRISIRNYPMKNLSPFPWRKRELGCSSNLEG